MQSVNCWWETHIEDAKPCYGYFVYKSLTKRRWKVSWRHISSQQINILWPEWKQKHISIVSSHYSDKTPWCELHATEMQEQMYAVQVYSFKAVNTAIPCTVAANTSCCADVWQSSHRISAPIMKWNQSGETASSVPASNTQFRKHDMTLCLEIIVKLTEKKAGRFAGACRE